MKLFVFLISFVIANVYGGKLNEKILFGFPVAIEDAPYQAWLGNCGGVIISEQYILTAAHCGKIRYAGVGNANRSEMTYYAVNQTMIHEDYNLNDGYPNHDLSIVQLKKKLTFGENVQSIPLSDKTPEAGESVLITGFGTTEKGKLSKILLGIDQVVVSFEECKKRVEKYEIELRESAICTDHDEPYHHAFFGDSGGPLVSNKNENLIGIASWVVDEFSDNLTGFIDVSLYKDWIRNKTNIQSL